MYSCDVRFPCLNGTYCIGGTAQPKECPVGGNCLERSLLPTQCRNGSFDNLTGAKSDVCKSCAQRPNETNIIKFCTKSTDSVFNVCNAPCFIGSYEVQACTLFTDRICGSCNQSFYCPDGVNRFICTQRLPSTYEISGCNVTSNYVHPVLLTRITLGLKPYRHAPHCVLAIHVRQSTALPQLIASV